VSVYRRKYKNRYKWYVCLILPDGSKFRKVVGTKKEAEKVEQKLRSEIVAGKWELWERQEILFDGLVEEYLEYAENSKSRSAYTCDKSRILGHLLPYFDKMPVNRITAQMVDSYKSMRMKQKAAPKTIVLELSNLSHMLKMAVRWRYVDKNVAEMVEKPKLVKNSPRFLTQYEIKRLIEAAQGSHIYPLIVTA
jgi:hypothetical protein